ncbi:MAG TPA: SCO family protein [Thermoanaerobaculia bacterium]|nr:SCO family protein [Thermoanaerobaculia bacterium]
MISALVATMWLHAATVTATPAPPPSVQRLELPRPIPDVEVIDQDGHTRKFYSELIRGKTVVVNAVYTSCTSYCPLMGKTFDKLQAALGDRLGRDVYLVSISRDPENDTPEQLAQWRQRFHGKRGWTFVTGKKEAIDAVLLVLTGDPAFKGGHSQIALLGDDQTGIWLREYGGAEPAQYQRLLQYLSDERSKTRN